MRFFATSILVALAAANICYGIKIISGTVTQNCIITCNDNTPTCGRSISSGQCKYYSSACGLVTDNCQSQQYSLVNLRQCDGLQNGQTGYCIYGNGGGTGNGGGNGNGNGTTTTGNGNRRRNRRNRRNGNRRNRRNRRNKNRTG